MPHLALRQLLPLSDRHPPRSVGLTDLGGDPDLLRDLVASGVLRETPMRQTVADALVIEIGGELYCVSPDGDDEPEKISAGELLEFEIDGLALARHLRKLFGLTGADVETVTRRLMYVGCRGQGARREAVFLARGVSPERALEDAALVRGHDPAQRHTILVPTERNLPVSVIRQVEAQGVRTVVVEELLAHAAAPEMPPWASAESAVRLVIDTDGKVCKLDGQEVILTPREFAVLVELASEAANEGGVVSRARIFGAIEDATGHDNRQDEQIHKVVSTLRKKLGRNTPIETRRKMGYRLGVEPAAIAVF